MNLRDFISETLEQIVLGVDDARREVGKNSIQGEINPRRSARMHREVSDRGDQIYTVQFDVAVTASSSTETKGGIAVMAGFVGLGSSGQSSETDSNVSRIQFEVPVSYTRHKFD